MPRTNARMVRVDCNWIKSGGRPSPMARVFDIACLNEQSRNNDGHEGSSDGVLSDYPTVHCGIL